MNRKRRRKRRSTIASTVSGNSISEERLRIIIREEVTALLAGHLDGREPRSYVVAKPTPEEVLKQRKLEEWAAFTQALDAQV